MSENYTDAQKEQAYEALEVQLRYEDELTRSIELEDNEFRNHKFDQLAIIVGKKEDEIRAEFANNGTLF